MIEEKEAKEDQGDDRLQVGRIGAEIFWGFHGGWPDRCRDFWELSWGLVGWVRGGILAFMGFVRIGVGSYFDLHEVRLVGVGGSFGPSRGVSGWV